MDQKYDKTQASRRYRIENFERQHMKLTELGYKQFISTISVLRANVYAFLTAGPFIVVSVIIYVLKWKQITFAFGASEALLFSFLIMASIPLHEIIHGIAWSTQCKNNWRSIFLGVMWKKLTPYCHCMEPLTFGGYLLGVLAPFLILGIGVFLIALFTNNALILILSLFNMLSAGGDTTLAMMILPYPKAIFLDHPSECGFAAYIRL